VPVEGIAAVPVWTLTTQDADVPRFADETALTSQRLAELRSVLAAMSASPIATLEVHPLTENIDRGSGIPLGSASPLAQQLSTLIQQTSKSTPAVNVLTGGEALYRMVVPAKVAAQVGSGLLKSMPSKAAAGGIHGAITGTSGIAAQATFVPVAKTAAVGAAGVGALTVAAPLILLAVAAGVSAHAENQRQKALEQITKLLEKLDRHNLDTERDELDGSRDAIDKATAVLLDRGRPGATLGLDTAVGDINKAIAATRRRLKLWQTALNGLPAKIEQSRLQKDFPGIYTLGGEFRTHLQLAGLAIALKRRVLVLQAVEHAQSDGTNPFKAFTEALKEDGARIDELENDISEVLRSLSRVQLTSSRRVVDMMVSSGDVDKVLSASYRLRSIGDTVEASNSASDVVIDIARNRDGSLLVLPAHAV
jgi:nucleotide-binding universal stress UspA family protein